LSSEDRWLRHTHHIVTLNVTLPQENAGKIQIVINDTLGGVVSANASDSVSAFGQGYVTGRSRATGIHDAHCSTHPSADNGRGAINGVKTPNSCTLWRQRFSTP
jgi:hypothetical protein